MATDLDPKTDPGEAVIVRPNLKIVGLHIRGLKSIGSLDLPADGLGWDGPIPDFVMVGGINGSGKTTLLEFLASAFAQVENYPPHGQFGEVPPELQAMEASVDFSCSIPDQGVDSIRFLVGNQEFINNNDKIKNCFGFQYRQFLKSSNVASILGDASSDSKAILVYYLKLRRQLPGWMSGPSLVYFPSERRTLVSPETHHKFAGKISYRSEFVDRWGPPKTWEDSLEARLYSARWEDLNAKEEGRHHEAMGFESYSRAFDRFFEGRKQLKWHRAELVVETKSGDIHDLSELSSGEKQVILFMGELLHRWRPGSLILIDEPELHLHESYQTKLWESLIDWQKERGGQVIVSTQSGHLFRFAHSAMKVLLSRQSR